LIVTRQEGTYHELLEKNGAFAEFLRNYAQTDEDEVVEGDPTGDYYLLL